MRPADSASGAGDDDHPAVEQPHGFSLSLVGSWFDPWFAFEADRYGGDSTPPCTLELDPLMYDAASDAKNAAAQPISSGRASRPSGTVAATAACDALSP